MSECLAAKCGHCCHDMGKMFGNVSDAQQFEDVGNQLIVHDDLQSLSTAVEPGLHVAVMTEGDDPEVRMTLIGPCTALDIETMTCTVHATALLPLICTRLQVGGYACRAARAANGMHAGLSYQPSE